MGGVSGTRTVGGIRSNGNSSMSCFIWLPIHEERLCLLDTIEYVYIADYVHIYIYIFARKRMTWGNGWRTRYTLVSSASPVSPKLHIRNMMWFNHHACRYKYVSLYANKNKSRVTNRRMSQDVRTSSTTIRTSQHERMRTGQLCTVGDVIIHAKPAIIHTAAYIHTYLRISRTSHLPIVRTQHPVHSFLYKTYLLLDPLWQLMLCQLAHSDE